MDEIPKGILKVEVPASRYRLLKGDRPPAPKDVLELDQGFTNVDGKAMVLAYSRGTDGEYNYEIEVYESEIE